MRGDGFQRIRAPFVCVDQKQNTEVQNEEIFQNIEALSLVRTMQQKHSGCNEEANSNNNEIGNDIVIVVHCTHNQQEEPDKEK